MISEDTSENKITVSGWRNFFPPAQWLPSYQSKWIKKDIVAGVTLAAYAIPVSLAYATLAGLPPQYGIYCYLVGGLFYAFFGTSRQLAIGPTSAISMVVGVTVAGMANGDMTRWAEVAALTALVLALMSLLAWLLRLSSVVSFISETILLGFKAGAALTIALTQLPKLFGVKGGGENFFERLGILGGQLGDTNVTVLIFGLCAIAFLVIGEKFLPGRPVALMVVVLSILALSFTSLGALGFKIVGELPKGLPDFHLPSLRVRDVDGVIPLAFACFLLSYIESISSARTLAERNNYEVDARQELLALSVANAAAAFGQGYPVAGGLSQSSVNDKAGAKTPLALVFASVTIGLCLMFLTGLLYNLPNVILAAIVLVAVKGLIDIKGLRQLWKLSRYEFMIAMVAFAGVLLLGILKGVLLAAVISILLLLRRSSNPQVAILGRVPGSKSYSDLARHPENEIIPGMLIIRIESSLLYYNTDNVFNKIKKQIQSARNLRLVLFDLSAVPAVDISGSKMFMALNKELSSKGMQLKIVDALSNVREILRLQGMEDHIGRISRRLTVEDVVEQFEKENLKS